MPGYPIEVGLSGEAAVAVGLGWGVGRGWVGCRKAAGLLGAGGREVGVAPGAVMDGGPEGVEVLAEPYEARHLSRSGARLAVAAATPEVNLQVVLDARAAGVWV